MGAMRRTMMAAVCSSLAATGFAHATDAVQWRVEDGGNGHWYEGVVITERMAIPPNQICWQRCQDYAVSVGAHLVTLTSNEEDSWVFAQVASNPVLWNFGAPWPCCGFGPYLGAYAFTGSWRWVTNEPWGHTHWNPYQYADPAGAIGAYTSRYTGAPSPDWDDTEYQCGGVNWPPRPGAVLEWSADCNNDGVVDYGQCRDGSLPDYNGNNIPDCCEQGPPCVVGSYPVEWRLEDGGNGHWYQTRIEPGSMSWDAARDSALSIGGHLVTITSNPENALVKRVAGKSTAFTSFVGPWLGGHQVSSAPDFSEPAGGWRWVTGEPWFSVWAGDEPNNGGTGEDFLCLAGTAPLFADMNWNDFGPHYWVQPNSYVTEWSADCNADGKNDYGQVLRGELADSDGDGIPDGCDELHVPALYATIQQAVAAATATRRTILVAPGTYAGPIDFLGKDIALVGAGVGQSIIDGNGGQVKSVVYVEGSPATARLEGFTIRNGTTGQGLPDDPASLCGGGLLAVNSAFTVRNCRFEDNYATYGGGAYFRYGSAKVENCQFVSNVAASRGGGSDAFESSTSFTDCFYYGNRAAIGGGMQLVRGQHVVERTRVELNFAGSLGGGIHWHSEFPTAALVLRDSEILDNNSKGNASGLSIFLAQSTAQTVLEGTTVCGNLPRNIVGGPYTADATSDVCDCRADVVFDGIVGAPDLSLVLGAWGPAAVGAAADINMDGIVNAADVSSLLASWGACARE